MSGTKKISIEAPLKINLRLKVEGVRPDGYHELSMLNAVSQSLCDRVEIEVVEDGQRNVLVRQQYGPLVSISREKESELDNVEHNLAAKAARIFVDEFGWKASVSISIGKNIPIGAGLAGGSSDAGAVLRGLSKLWGEKSRLGRPELSALDAQLLELGRGLGADVPYCLFGGFAFVSGAGEKLFRLSSKPLSELSVCLCLSKVSVPTSLVFKRYDELYGRECKVLDRKMLEHRELLSMETSDLEAQASVIYDMIENDLQSSALDLFPELQECFERLSRIENAKLCLSGSGSSMFVIARRDEISEELLTERASEALQGLNVECLTLKNLGSGIEFAIGC